jgi:hypothetical protein
MPNTMNVAPAPGTVQMTNKNIGRKAHADKHEEQKMDN